MRKIKSLLVIMLLLVSLTSILKVGNTLDQPFPVYGYIKDSNGNAIPGGIDVTIKDVTKSTQMSISTQSNGYYQANLSNLGNCENGDSIEIYCSYQNEDNAKTFALNVAQPSKNVSFSLIGKPDVLTNDATDITSGSAKLNGELTDLKDTSCQVWFEYGKTTSYGQTTAKGTKYSPTPFFEPISGLQPDSTYHFRAVAKNSRKTAYGADKTFHTSPTLPQVTTNAATGIGYDSAILNGYLSKVGANSCNVWFVYDDVSHEKWWEYAHETHKYNKTSASSFSSSISGLELDTTYHFRVVAQNSAGNVSGDDAAFTTHVVLPSVNTLDAENVTSNSAILRGNLKDLGGDENCSVWFEYGETTSYGHSTTNISLGSAAEFDAQIYDLGPGKTYHFRAAVKNSKGTSYGSDKIFTTSAVKAEVETGSVEYAVVLKANVTSMGGDESCQVWFEYNENGDKNATQTQKKEVNNKGMFTEVITGLKENSTYYYRAVINNSQGISYGTNLSFKMLSLPVAPAIETLSANQSYNNATLHANITSLGGSTFCYVWFEYWDGEKHSTPVEIINNTGKFNTSIEGLEDGENYHYKAIAVGANGRISYGGTNNFTTLSLENHEPIVSLLSPGNNSTVNIGTSLIANVYDEDGDMMNVTFYLDESSVYSGILKSGIVSVALPLDYGKNYSWHVIANDRKNSSMSNVYYFSTIKQMIANFSHSFVFEGETAFFNDTSTGEIEQWSWDFGDGNINYEKNTIHIYEKAGSYTVNLTIIDVYGNTLHKEKEVMVWKRGDANMDGNINALDITKIERILEGMDNEPVYPHPADADGDQDVDNDDMVAVINKILGFT